MKVAGVVVAVLSLSVFACTSASVDDGESDPVAASSDALRTDGTCQHGKSYIARKNQCAVIRFLCPVGESYFSDGRGCGCTCGNACPIIDCAAPPSGCHYEGAVFTPCDQQTCGQLVCDGTNL